MIFYSIITHFCIINDPEIKSIRYLSNPFKTVIIVNKKMPYFRRHEHLSKVVRVYNFCLISKDFFFSHQNICIEIYPQG